jgi:hypothetical protein
VAHSHLHSERSNARAAPTLGPARPVAH